jgi:hypothetical protein
VWFGEVFVVQVNWKGSVSGKGQGAKGGMEGTVVTYCSIREQSQCSP